MKPEEPVPTEPNTLHEDLAIGEKVVELTRELQEAGGFLDMSYSSFEDFLTDLNATVRNLPQDKSNYFDGGNGNGIGLHAAPELAKKKQYLEKAFNIARGLDNNKDGATLMYYSVLAIHPFVDGNGRTSRVLYELIDNGNTTEQNIAELVDHQGDYGQYSSRAGGGLTNVDKELVSPDAMWQHVRRELNMGYFGEDIVGSVNKDYVVPWHILSQMPGPDQKMLKIISRDRHPLSVAAVMLFEQDLARRHLVSKKPVQYGFTGDEQKYILEIEEDSFETLSVDNCEKLINIYKTVKDDSYNMLFDFFENPENHIVNDVCIKDALHRENAVEFGQLREFTQ